jgi:hypothetical protein
MWFLHMEWQTRRVSDTHPKPDGYGYEFLPVDIGTDTNFYPQSLYWRVGNYSTWPEPDQLSFLLTVWSLLPHTNTVAISLSSPVGSLTLLYSPDRPGRWYGVDGQTGSRSHQTRVRRRTRSTSYQLPILLCLRLSLRFDCCLLSPTSA